MSFTVHILREREGTQGGLDIARGEEGRIRRQTDDYLEVCYVVVEGH